MGGCGSRRVSAPGGGGGSTAAQRRTGEWWWWWEIGGGGNGEGEGASVGGSWEAVVRQADQAGRPERTCPRSSSSEREHPGSGRCRDLGSRRERRRHQTRCCCCQSCQFMGSVCAGEASVYPGHGGHGECEGGVSLLSGKTHPASRAAGEKKINRSWTIESRMFADKRGSRAAVTGVCLVEHGAESPEHSLNVC